MSEFCSDEVASLLSYISEPEGEFQADTRYCDIEISRRGKRRECHVDHVGLAEES